MTAKTSADVTQAQSPTIVKLEPQITGNVGRPLYYCCYKLSLLGWNVMPTARNARGVDLIAYSEDASRFIGVQVKALSKRASVLQYRWGPISKSAWATSGSL